MIVSAKAAPRLFSSHKLFVLAYVLYVLAVAVGYQIYELGWISIHFSPIGSLGTAGAIILGFRNSAAYDRWWEARRLWGGLVNISRTFTRQVLSLTGPTEQVSEVLSDLRKQLLDQHLAFCHCLRFHLRRQSLESEVVNGLRFEEKLNQARNKPNFLLRRQALTLNQVFFLKEEGMSHHERVQIDSSLNEMTNILGACERIKNTPLPKLYDSFSAWFINVYILILPLGLVRDQGWWMIPIALAIGGIFASLNLIASFNEDPFENRFSDTPMTAICRTIEIDIKEAQGLKDIPSPLTPENGVLM